MTKQATNAARGTNTKKTIASWTRNSSREIVRVQLEKLGGRNVINIRVWRRASDGTLIPTQHGITLVTEQIPNLAGAMLKACMLASKRGLIA